MVSTYVTRRHIFIDTLNIAMKHLQKFIVCLFLCYVVGGGVRVSMQSLDYSTLINIIRIAVSVN